MRKIQVIVAIVTLSIIGLFFYFNVYNDCEVDEEIGISIDREYLIYSDYNVDGKFCDDTFEALVKRYKGEETDFFFNGEVLNRSNGELPSDNIEDYVFINMQAKIKNNSIFKMNDISCKFEFISDDSRILYSEEPVVLININSLETKTDNTFISFIMYTAGMSDEDIVEYINDLDVQLYYNNKLSGNKVKGISLSKAKILK